MGELLALERGGANPDTSLKGDTPKADASTAPTATGRDAAYLRVLVFALFFFFGGITSLNDVIIPKLKQIRDR